MRKLRYHIVDVFTRSPFGGNPLAVFTRGAGIDPALMQNIARELNLSETTFVLPPEDARANFRVRIFTPSVELPMAGHPTIGTAFVLAREDYLEPEGDECRTVFEEGVGLIPVTIVMHDGRPGRIWMEQPLPRYGRVFEDRATAAAMLGLADGDLLDLPLEAVSCGVPFLFVPVCSLDAVRRIRLALDLFETALRKFDTSMVFVFTRETEDQAATVHSRMFAPFQGVMEDPATGSASGPLGCYLLRHGLVNGKGRIEMVSEQGIELGRPSYIHVEIDHDGARVEKVRVGGDSFSVGEGCLEL